MIDVVLHGPYHIAVIVMVETVVFLDLLGDIFNILHKVPLFVIDKSNGTDLFAFGVVTGDFYLAAFRVI